LLLLQAKIVKIGKLIVKPVAIKHWSQVKLESQLSRGFEHLEKRRNLVNFSVAQEMEQ
jgi:hypothetical protein